MPLVEARGTGFAFRGGDVRREVEFLVVDALDFEAGREPEVAVGQGPATEDVDLGLHGDRGALGDAVEVGAVVVG